MASTSALTSYSEREIDLDLVELGNIGDRIKEEDVEAMIGNLALEQVLRFVRIPQFQNSKDDEGERDFGFIFDRLRAKGVTRIIRLEVDEQIDWAHSDTAIIRTIQGFQIDELDWRKTDLSSNVLFKGVPNVQTLCLYSSGNYAVLGSWSAAEGLVQLRKVSVLSRQLS